MYKYLKESISNVIHGFNCTIFAYGQTGSGKTHTMFGKEQLFLQSGRSKSSFITDLAQQTDDEHLGIIPRAVHSLFSSIQNSKITVCCSFI